MWQDMIGQVRPWRQLSAILHKWSTIFVRCMWGKRSGRVAGIAIEPQAAIRGYSGLVQERKIATNGTKQKHPANPWGVSVLKRKRNKKGPTLSIRCVKMLSDQAAEHQLNATWRCLVLVKFSCSKEPMWCQKGYSKKHQWTVSITTWTSFIKPESDLACAPHLKKWKKYVITTLIHS